MKAAARKRKTFLKEGELVFGREVGGATRLERAAIFEEFRDEMVVFAAFKKKSFTPLAVLAFSYPIILHLLLSVEYTS